MKFISVKCPECAATLSIRKDREFCFCEYCGTKIVCIDENSYTHIYKQTYTKINAAELIRAETERIIALNNIKKEENERKSRKRKEVFRIIGQILLFPFILAKKTLRFAGPLIKFLFKFLIVLVLLFLVFVGIMGFVEGPYELGFVGFGAGYLLYLMWKHRETRKK